MRPSPTWHVALCAFTLACGMVVPGCNSASKSSDEDLAKALDKIGKETDTKGRPKFEVAGQSLGDSQEVSLSSNDLLRRIQELIVGERQARAIRWIQRHPEAALTALRTNAGEKADQTHQLLAAVQDGQALSVGVQQSWTKLFAEAKQRPAAVKAYIDARKKFQASLTQGHVAHALRIDLMQLANNVGAPLLLIDALQLQGIAHLLNEQPD
jgi:hypothetical protein